MHMYILYQLMDIPHLPPMHDSHILTIEIEKNQMVMVVDVGSSMTCNHWPSKTIKMIFMDIDDIKKDIRFLTYKYHPDLQIDGKLYNGYDFLQQFYKDDIGIEIVDICFKRGKVVIVGQLLQNRIYMRNYYVQIIVNAGRLIYK